MRRTLLVALYEQGLDSHEIATRLCVSEERVRQLLRAYAVPLAPIWERRFRQAVKGREGEIVATFLRLRSDSATARELGLQPRHVRRLVDLAVPEARVLRRARRASSPLYSDEQIIAALRDAARELPAPLSIEGYRRWTQNGGGRERPGPELIKVRFGGWRRALARAGLPTNSRSGPRATYEFADVVRAIAAAWREIGRYPSVARYEAWRGGRTDLPAAATARRFAPSWDNLLVAAYPLVYGRPAAPRLATARVPESQRPG